MKKDEHLCPNCGAAIAIKKASNAMRKRQKPRPREFYVEMAAKRKDRQG